MSYPVALLVEVELDGVWTDITQWVRQTIPVTITRGKANEAAKVAPSTCTLTLLDPDGDFFSGNPLGAYYGLIGRNTPLRVSADGEPRFTGEISSMVPRWNVTHTVRQVAVRASGILRRLGQGRSPAQSAPRRYIPESRQAGTGVPKPPVGYWPLDDGELAVEAAPVIGNHPARINSTRPLSDHFGRGKLASWLPNGVTLYGGDEILGAVDMPGFVDQWALDVVLRPADLTTDFQVVAFTTTGEWVCRFTRTGTTDSGTITVTTPVTVDTAGLAAGLWDGQPHHIRLYAVQDGADVAWYHDIDGVNVNAQFAGPVHTLGPMVGWGVGDLTAHTETWGIGHVAVYGQDRPTADFARPVLGWQGEPAGRRVERLCTENGIPFASLGDLEDTVVMGPQRPATVLTLITECVDADLGLLSEPRDVFGLGYRTRRDLYNQTPAVTLDYSAEEVARTFQPAEDDQAVRNRIIVRRPGGGEVTAELTEGPLSTADPPTGVGVYDHTHDANVEQDAQLPGTGGWLLRLGTVDEPRYPKVRVELTADTVSAALAAAVLGVELGDLVEVIETAVIHTYDPIRVMVLGCTETLTTAKRQVVEFNAAPASPYRVGEVGSTSWAVPDTAELAAGIDTDDVTLSVTVEPLFMTSATTYPIEITIGGELMVLTAVSGAGSPQTFTVTRSANGVVKPHLAGAPLSIVDHLVAVL